MNRRQFITASASLSAAVAFPGLVPRLSLGAPRPKPLGPEVDAIKRALEYQVLGRKLLLVDQLPQGALTRYEKDVSAFAERRLVCNPEVRLSEIKGRRFHIVDKAPEQIQTA